MFRHTRLFVLVLALLTGCGAPSSTPNSSTAVPQTPQPTTITQPASQEPSDAPIASDEPASPSPASPPASIQPAPIEAPLEPLPAPELNTVDEIVELMYERGQADQVIVSMLDELGIGIYEADGRAIRAGSEAGDGDLYLFEPEVRGLIGMLRQNYDQESWVQFRDFHAALADLGLSGSAEELAHAYSSAYEADFESPMAKLVYGMTGVDVEAPMPPLAVWLLFVDGFVTPNGLSEPLSGQGFAMIGGEPLIGGAPAEWGVARDNIKALMSVPLEADPLVIAHLMGVVASSSVTVSSVPGNTHEGHGGTGAPVGVTATVRAIASVFVSPFSNRPLIPANPTGSVAGIPVRWHIDDAMNAHGSTDALSAPITDPLGQAGFTFTPRAEDANGEGYLTREFSTVQASVSASQLINQLYGLPSLGALVGGEIRGLANVEIEWHEPEAMRISLVNDYDVTLDLILGVAHGKGKDSFEGILALQDDGTWRGVVTGTTTASYQGRVANKSCQTTWSANQLVEVVGAEAPYAIDGDFYFRFYPVTPPSGSLGSGLCKPSLASYDGIDYAPYNHYSVTAAEDDQGLVVYLPERPGGVRDYPVNLPGTVQANWNVNIEFLEPQ